jgi:flagellar hook-length control protein FliK
MQTTTLPIQLTSADPALLRANASANANSDAAQFSAALSRGIEQRQEQAAPPPARPAGQSKPAQADKNANAGSKAPEAAKAAQSDSPDKAADKSVDKTSDSADAADQGDDSNVVEHPAAAQVTDMLALVASLNQALGKTAPAATNTEQAAAVGSAKAGAEGVQLASLQARARGNDTGETGAAKAFDALGQQHNPAGATLAADAQAGTRGFDAGATPALLGKLHAQAEVAQARESLPQAAATQDSLPSAQLLAQMQPAALEAAHAAAGAASNHIPARVGSTGWDQQVGQKIVWMAAGDAQSAEMTLNPPDLGPLQIVLSVSNDQASVQFSSNQLEVRQALENALPRLREMMGESGIALGNATVNAGLPDQRQAQGETQTGHGRGAAPGPNGIAATGDSASAPAPRITRLGERGRVDTFA